MSSLVTLEENAGLVEVEVRLGDDPASTDHGVFEAPRLPERLSGPLDAVSIAQALGIDADDVGFDGHRPTAWSAGVPFTFIPIASREALAKASLSAGRWATVFGHDPGLPGDVFLYCHQNAGSQGAANTDFETRMFAPDDGIPEGVYGRRVCRAAI